MRDRFVQYEMPINRDAIFIPIRPLFPFNHVILIGYLIPVVQHFAHGFDALFVNILRQMSPGARASM